ncbi:MAG: NAD(+)--dinitrogen-reductase ADP-D-ribosyltransferase [Saccharofermentanales bacterium]
MIDWLKKLLAGMTSTKLADMLTGVGVKAYKIGREEGFADTEDQEESKEEGPREEPRKRPLDPDSEAMESIGVRTHALSEKTISDAKGTLSVEVDKLYKEMDAAMKAGMTEKDALIKIQDRMKGLFSEAFPPWKLERLVRDQFTVATKEGRRSAWEESGVQYRQWVMHLDSHTGDDSKRMHGQITKINEPYIDPLTDERYMIPHIRPNDRCFEIPLYELPEETKEKNGLLYAKVTIPNFYKYSSDFFKGGPGSGIKGHTTPKKLTPKERKILDDYRVGVKKLANEYKEKKDKGGDIKKLQKEFKTKFEEHRQTSIKAFMGEHKFTREQAKARKEARNQKKQTPVESKKPEPVKEPKKPKQSEEEKKAKRKARREARKQRKAEEPKKPDTGGINKDEIMNKPHVKEFLKVTKGMSIKEKMSNMKRASSVGLVLQDWQEGRYGNLDYAITSAFGLDEGNHRQDTLSDIHAAGKDSMEYMWGKNLEEGIHQYYAMTQEYLKQKYPSGFITIYRGVDGDTPKEFGQRGLKEGDECNLKCYNVSSWSENRETAESFGKKHGEGVTIKAEIPIERVLLHHKVLYGHMPDNSYTAEEEISILGDEVRGQLVKYHHPG